MMKLQLIALLITILFLACNQQENTKTTPVFQPVTVEAHGKVIHADSIQQPEKVLAGNPIKIKAVKSPDISTTTNIKEARAPKISVLGTPTVVTPGQNGVPSPIEISSKGKTYLSGIPEIIIAKDAYSKDINPYSFTAFGTIQGLKHNQIRCLIQDRRGNLWFSNDDGVTRYDGKYLTHFSVKNGLSANIVLCMLEDSDGSLWFGTFGGGITRYDGKHFTHFTEKEGLSNNVVNSIIQDRNGNYWFATSGGGVSKFDGEKFTHYTAQHGLGHNQIRSILEDNNGIIWFGTFGGGVTSFDGTSFANYSTDSGFPGTHVVSMFQDQQYHIWFGTYNNGVIKFDGSTFYKYSTEQGLSDENILCIIQDHQKSMWFGTTRGGISKFDGKKFTHYTEKEGLTNNYVRCALIDRQGNRWFGTRDGGLVKFNGTTITHFTENEGLANNKILNIYPDKAGNFWFGAFNGGVTKFDGEKMTSFSLQGGLLNDRIYSIAEDENGNLWFGSDGKGVAKYDGQYFYHYTYAQGLCHDGIRKVLIDSNGNFWFCSYGGGVSMFDGVNFTNYSSKTGLGSSKVLSMLEDQEGNLWFGTDDNGAVKFDGKNFTRYSVNEGLSHNSVASILQDKQGNIWFGTSGGGLTKYDGRYFTKLTEKEGLTNDYVTSLFQDKDENIWIGTRLGVNVLEPGRLEKKLERPEIPLFKSYSYDDGFLGIGCNLGAIEQDSSGTIWIGSTNRLTAIYPKNEVPDTVAPEIQLTNVQLFNKNIPWIQLEDKKDTSFVLENGLKVGNFRFTNVSAWYHLPENLSLAYNNNFMTFSYIGISQKQKIKYQYQLMGLDEKWSNLTDRTEVSYGNLKPGSYVFKVKAMNSEGRWSNEYQYKFTIRPPWWNTWWFYLLSGLAFIALIMSYINWRERELGQQKIVLEQKVKEQTFELANKNQELQVINQELVTLNSEKDKFFSIISHDVRGPLSAFLSLTEIMADDLPSFTLDEIQNMTGAMRNSAANLLELFGNLLEWSRMQRGLVVSHPEELKLNMIITKSTDSVELAAQNKSIRITINVPEEINVWADKNILGLIIRNLVSNAVKFTNNGGDIRISAKTIENMMVEISVTDNGIGMKKQLLNNLFRIDENTSRPGTNGEPSTGLGLLLCKDFVEMQGGRLWAESIEGKGSTFYFTLKQA
jgi:ligand-binding sensor domain-containing protein/signal transduction histidine kinase